MSRQKLFACLGAFALVTLSLVTAHAQESTRKSRSAVQLTSADSAVLPVSGCASGCTAIGGCSAGECLVSDSCGSSCGCAGACRCCEVDERLFGLFAASDHCFDGFISPMTNPVYFEDPRTLTEARFVYIHHTVPTAVGGGEIDLFALQLRAALNDWLSVIATKDGYLTSSNPAIDDGWADLSAGLKAVLYRDPERQRLLSAGVLYELPTGSGRSLQGTGDGLFNLFLSGGAEIGPGHWISGTGLLLPTNTTEESQMWFWSNHFDVELINGIYALAELNWYHWMKSGNGGIPGVEGGDLFNLGSTGVAGNDIWTGAFGLKYKPSGNMEIGVAWENPLTSRRDVLDDRLTFDWIFRY